MSRHTTAKFLEKTRRSTEIVNEATKFAYSKIQKWIDYTSELQEQAELFERQITTPISKPSNLMLDGLLDLDEVIYRAFEKFSLKNIQQMAEARNKYNELERRREEAKKAEDELQYRLNEKRQEMENEIRKIDEELAELEALCNALGCHHIDAIVSINGSR
uniref:Uncharacterized protein n=1 Tax=Acrobeloides nanus TaxID=290746 RepID=A0A914CAM2_9BILA